MKFLNCHFLKRELNSNGKKLNFGLKTSFLRMRKEYKKILKETKQKFIKAIVEKLDSKLRLGT
jgi:hypothetical protein